MGGVTDRPKRPARGAPVHFVHARPPAAGIDFSPALSLYGGVSMIRTAEGNFASGPFDLTIEIPGDFLFFPQYVGIAVRYADTVGTLGSVRFGTPASPALYLGSTAATITLAHEREEWLIRSLSSRKTAVSRLSAGLATSGVLTQALGYFYFVGYAVKQ